MKILLTILLFTCLFAAAQTPFIPGTKYNVGWVVVDNTGVQWRCIANTKSRNAPAEGPTWTRVTQVVPETKRDTVFITRVDTLLIPSQLDPNGITRSTIDSLMTRIKKLESTSVTSLDTRLKTLEKDPGSMFLKVSMEGYPLVKIVGDTVYIRSLNFGPGKKVTETNSTLKIE